MCFCCLTRPPCPPSMAALPHNANSGHAVDAPRSTLRKLSLWEAAWNAVGIDGNVQLLRGAAC